MVKIPYPLLLIFKNKTKNHAKSVVLKNLNSFSCIIYAVANIIRRLRVFILLKKTVQFKNTLPKELFFFKY